MKGGRRILKALLLLPVLLIALVVLYEVVGMAVNHAASARQTSDVIRRLEASLPLVEIIDSYTETGNTSGTGNHVDMLSAVIFWTEAGAEEIQQAFQAYEDLDEWSFWIKPMKEIVEVQEKYPYIYPFLGEMNSSEELEHGWLLYLNTSAPFPGNIEGH